MSALSFTRAALAALLAAPLLLAGGQPAEAADAHGQAAPPSYAWPHGGVFGTYDRAALQRGWQVYKTVCAACHGLEHMSYRHLSGLGYSKEEIEGIASQDTISDGPDDQGEMFDRPGKGSDPIRHPYPNRAAAAAVNGGKAPPDLSLIVKARPNGANYIRALLLGYKSGDQLPPDVKLADGQYYNEYFPGHIIAMAPPLLSEGQAPYEDGTKATVEQMATDVTQFLSWAAEPELEQRKRLGVQVLIFLGVLSALMYRAKKKIWANLPH